LPGSRLTAEERSQVARIAALERWSKQDAKSGTAAAREAFDNRFLEQVDPNNELPEDERRRRAIAARKAYFARLALRSAQARRKKVASDAATA
jgi:hypothetical protein